MSDNNKNGQTQIPGVMDQVTYIKLPDGTIKEAHQQRIAKDPKTGRWIKAYIRPKYPEGFCANPDLAHGYVEVYLGYNGVKTDKDNLLCIECHKRNNRKKLLNFFFGWIYEQEIY